MTNQAHARPAQVASGRPTDLTLAGATTAISMALLVLMPLVAGLDDDLAGDTPSLGGWVWWVAAVAVAAQGAWLLWSSARPRLVLAVVPLIAAVAAIAPLGTIANITLVALVPAAYVATRLRAVGHTWHPWLLALVLASVTGWLTNVRDADASPVIAIGSAIVQALLLLGIPTAIAQGVRGRAARSDEFALLGRIGATKGQMRSMLAIEGALVAVGAVAIGTLTALPGLTAASLSLISGFQLGLDLTVYGGLALAATAIAFLGMTGARLRATV